MFVKDEHQWAQDLFGQAQLGDKRRTDRLVRYAADQARHPQDSTLSACQGDQAAALGAYRLLRNEQVDPEKINQAAFEHVARLVARHEVVLALEDTTTLSFFHSVRDQLGDLGGKAQSKKRGYFVHSVLLVEPQSRQPLGLVHQQWWRRRGRGKKHTRKQRPYSQKESFKWQKASASMLERLGDQISKLIAVADREADVFEYLFYKQAHGQRYIVRAAQDRGLKGQAQLQRLRQYIAREPVAGQRTVEVPQRKGRRARRAVLSVRFAEVTLRVPRRRGQAKEADLGPVVTSVVWAQETQAPPGVAPLEWLLLTSEPVEHYGQAVEILDYYGLRPCIEQFHKAWKSGCGVEARRMQKAENLKRMAVILAHIAVRLLQLHGLRGRAEEPCEGVLSRLEWRCLWHSAQGGAPPGQVPSLQWAYYAVARLGGWQDTKGTGQVGWQTLWKGWMRLQERAEGWRMATEYNNEM